MDATLNQTALAFQPPLPLGFDMPLAVKFLKPKFNPPKKRDAAGLLLLSPDGCRVLLAKRADWMRNGGQWSTPGGVLEKGESALTGALRECCEETGADYEPAELDVLEVITEPTDGGARNYTTIVAIADYEAPTQPDGDETVDCAWIEIAFALKLNLHPGLLPVLTSIAA